MNSRQFIQLTATGSVIGATPHISAQNTAGKETQTVISGHTHRNAHLPANKSFPYAQIVGGGPKMPQARLITGKTDERQLVFSVNDMTGKVTHNHRFESTS